MKIGKEIALEAKKAGICGPWYKDMMNITNYKLLSDMYFKGDDWAMEYDFPNLSLLRQHSGGIKPYGMLVDFKGNVDNKLRLAVFGDSEITMNYAGFSVGNTIIRHNSKAKITVSDHAILYLNVLDNATVQVDCTSEGKAVVYAYGSSENITASGNVKIVKKKWEK